MAYNKAKEERKWRLWKEAEEKKLRSLGVDEDTIEQLRTHDWAIFNSDRRYCKCQYKIVGFLSYKNVGKPTRLYDIFCILIFLNHVLHLIL